MQSGKSVEHAPIVYHAVEAHGRNLDARLVQPTSHLLALVAQDIVLGDGDQRRRQPPQASAEARTGDIRSLPRCAGSETYCSNIHFIKGAVRNR